MQVILLVAHKSDFAKNVFPPARGPPGSEENMENLTHAQRIRGA